MVTDLVNGMMLLCSTNSIKEGINNRLETGSPSSQIKGFSSAPLFTKSRRLEWIRNLRLRKILAPLQLRSSTFDEANHADIHGPL